MSAHKKTHCVRGHERSPGNVMLDGRCRRCHNVRRRARYAQKHPNSRPRTPGSLRKTHCPRGHVRAPENLYACGHCRLCLARPEVKAKARERAASLRRRDPERANALVRHYRSRNIVRARERCRLDYWRDPTKSRAYHRAWRAKSWKSMAYSLLREYSDACGITLNNNLPPNSLPLDRPHLRKGASL
jgi:hypothetical protein